MEMRIIKTLASLSALLTILFMVIQFTSFLGFSDDICIIKLSMDMYAVYAAMLSITSHNWQRRLCVEETLNSDGK
jgi:hypothetical protein